MADRELSQSGQEQNEAQEEHRANHFNSHWLRFGLIAIDATGAHGFARERQRLRGDASTELNAVADIRTGQLDRRRKERLAQGQMIEYNPFNSSRIVGFIGRPVAGDTGGAILAWKDDLRTNLGDYS